MWAYIVERGQGRIPGCFPLGARRTWCMTSAARASARSRTAMQRRMLLVSSRWQGGTTNAHALVLGGWWVSPRCYFGGSYSTGSASFSLCFPHSLPPSLPASLLHVSFCLSLFVSLSVSLSLCLPQSLSICNEGTPGIKVSITPEATLPTSLQMKHVARGQFKRWSETIQKRDQQENSKLSVVLV